MISLGPRDSQSLLQHQFENINSSELSLLYGPTLTFIRDYWKNHSFKYIWTFVVKVMSLLLNRLSRFVIAFLPGSKCLLISWLQSSSTVILEPRKIKSATAFTFSPFICHEVMGLDTLNLVVLMLSFKPAFSLSFFDPHQEALLEKAMVPHSSTLAWKIPWTEEPGRL